MSKQKDQTTEAPNVNFQGRKCPQCGGRQWYAVWWGFTGCRKCGAEYPTLAKVEGGDA
jgi:ribosomal protein L40E